MKLKFYFDKCVTRPQLNKMLEQLILFRGKLWKASASDKHPPLAHKLGLAAIEETDVYFVLLATAGLSEGKDDVDVVKAKDTGAAPTTTKDTDAAPMGTKDTGSTPTVVKDTDAAPTVATSSAEHSGLYHWFTYTHCVMFCVQPPAYQTTHIHTYTYTRMHTYTHPTNLIHIRHIVSLDYS